MRIAVYSCVCGRYDEPKFPLITEECCDYYMISDDRNLAVGDFNWVDVDSIVPDKRMSPKDKNRYCKLHPHQIFTDYDYSIYFDGSIQVVKPISHYITYVGKSGLAMHIHRRSNCVYLESIILTWLGAVEKHESVVFIKKCIDAGLPKFFGMYECGMIVTDLNNLMGKELYNEWYNEYITGLKRDQQSLMLVLWKMKMSARDIGVIGNNINIYTNPDIDWNKTSHYK